MKQVYTQIKETYVMPEPKDIGALKLDNCAVVHDQGKLLIHPIDERIGKDAERENDSAYDAIFGSLTKKARRYLIVNGAEVQRKFCSFCKDRLNGITGNCFDYNVKKEGCQFTPSVEIKPFHMELEGYKKLKPSDTSRSSPFNAPYYPGEAYFDAATYKHNQKMRIVRRNLWDYAVRKKKKYCSHCIYAGLCWLNTRKVVEHCMVTPEETMKKCLEQILKRFGSVHEFLALLSYSGGAVSYKPKGAKRKTKWRISRPLNKTHFLAIKMGRPFRYTEVTRKRVERCVKPTALPYKGGDLTAALAWFFMERYCKEEGVSRIWAYRSRVIRPLWILPGAGSIEVAHYPYGCLLSRETISLESFNAILHFAR